MYFFGMCLHQLNFLIKDLSVYPGKGGVKRCRGLLLFLLALPFFGGCGNADIREQERRSFFIDLNKYPAYIKDGFDPRDVGGALDLSADPWYPIAPRVDPRKRNIQIRYSGLPGIPRRTFLSPSGEKDHEYTLLIPFTLGQEQFETLNRDSNLSPGLFLAALGDNWEIFLNGRMIRSEVHLDGEGRIRSHRSWRSIFFVMDKSLFNRGGNLLAFRILGAPDYECTGFFYKEPYYIGDYELIAKRNDESLGVALCGIYIFVGFYHLLLFFGRMKDRYHLCYCIFSFFLGSYLLLRTHTILAFFPDSGILFRLEYTLFYMLVPAMIAFLEHLNFKKISLFGKVYGGFCVLLAVSQWLFSLPYSEDTLILGFVLIGIGAIYVFSCDTIYVFFRSVYDDWKTHKDTSFFRVLWGFIITTPQGNILIGALFFLVTGFWDLSRAIYSNVGLVRYSRYGIFVFTIMTTVILVRHVGELSAQLDQMNGALERANINLEATVQERTRELELQTRKAESSSRAKSDFLARMSHEIRTPMNAVIGMSELALREETKPNMVVEYVNDIKQAGLNLLSIINDILDFSKIEARNLEITPVPYSLTSLINDVINLARIKIVEKNLLFVVNVDAAIPNNLIGDEVRIRQVLINLLSNAAKYTHQGYVKLVITGSPAEPERFLLRFDIIDSGIGIKPADIEKLFGDFVRLDLEQNKSIEGTGLGLAISRNLCRMMEGDVSISSEYGRGSVFSATILQSCLDDRRLAVVENPSKKTCLFFYDYPVYAESIHATLIGLKVPVTVCTKKESYFEELATGSYMFAFIAAASAAETGAYIKKRSLKTTAVILEDLRTINTPGNMPKLSMPAYAVPIVHVLNGAISERRISGRVRFIAPQAHILVVDDISTNLKVAEGLLMLYRIRIDAVTSGPEAIEMVQRHNYDIVLMDHMMPGMDGIEATMRIRALGDRFKKLPIIALTANVVSGMREMFLANGFDDYLAKPIEMSRLDDILKTWIPAEKKERPAESVSARPGNGGPEGGAPEPPGEDEAPPAADRPPSDTPKTVPGISIPGLDTARGIAMAGGSELVYREVLGLFCRDVADRLDVLRQPPEKDRLSFFIIQIHALKSAAANVGAVVLSGEAALLEEAGKQDDMETIGKRLALFREALITMTEEIKKILGKEGGTFPPS
jgi:signal transduction histidine kinase/DNA-binding NarL/FixJ family response regulator/HPt (histidine-containing phosphotransfer) domain-containing protein